MFRPILGNIPLLNYLLGWLFPAGKVAINGLEISTAPLWLQQKPLPHQNRIFRRGPSHRPLGDSQRSRSGWICLKSQNHKCRWILRCPNGLFSWLINGGPDANYLLSRGPSSKCSVDFLKGSVCMPSNFGMSRAILWPADGMEIDHQSYEFSGGVWILREYTPEV